MWLWLLRIFICTCNWRTSPYSLWSTTVPLQANSFLATLMIFFRSYSDERPCITNYRKKALPRISRKLTWTEVKVFLPFLCWIRTWTRPSCTDSSSPLAASAKGSNPLRFSMLDMPHKKITDVIRKWRSTKHLFCTELTFYKVGNRSVFCKRMEAYQFVGRFVLLKFIGKK